MLFILCYYNEWRQSWAPASIEDVFSRRFAQKCRTMNALKRTRQKFKEQTSVLTSKFCLECFWSLTRNLGWQLMLESYAEDERSCSSNSGNTVPWLFQKLPVEASTPVRINKTTCYVCDWSGTLLRSVLVVIIASGWCQWMRFGSRGPFAEMHWPRKPGKTPYRD